MVTVEANNLRVEVCRLRAPACRSVAHAPKALKPDKPEKAKEPTCHKQSQLACQRLSRALDLISLKRLRNQPPAG